MKLASVSNFRDLGGYRTIDGATVRTGRLYRSGHLASLSAQERQLLEQAGIRTVIDLRGRADIVRDGEAVLPHGAKWLNLNVFGDTARDRQPIREHIKLDERLRLEILNRGHGERLMTTVLMRLAFSRTEAFTSMLRCLADSGSLPAIVHCSSGKDRTGWAATLVLLALGVPERQVLDHYLLSNEYRKSEIDSAIASFSDTRRINGELLRPLLEVRPQYLVATFRAIRNRFGSLDAYLTKALKLDSESRQRLCDQFLV